MTDNGIKISRGTFFRILAGFLLLPAGILSWFSVTGDKKTYGKPRILKTTSIRKGFYYSEGVLISNDKELKIFSARCTHLGCGISGVTEGLAVCPCHGSKFDGNGNPVSGPATKPLKELKYSMNPENGELTVYEKERT